MLIQITADHITRGAIGFDDTASNALALAIGEVCQAGCSVWAAPDEIVIVGDDGADQSLPLNEAAELYLDALINNQPSEPFTIELDIRNEFLLPAKRNHMAG